MEKVDGSSIYPDFNRIPIIHPRICSTMTMHKPLIPGVRLKVFQRKLINGNGWDQMIGMRSDPNKGL
jgi:hypothetical protein